MKHRPARLVASALVVLVTVLGFAGSAQAFGGRVPTPYTQPHRSSPAAGPIQIAV